MKQISVKIFLYRNENNGNVIEGVRNRVWLWLCVVGVDLRESSNLKYLYELHDDFAALPPFVCIPSTVAVISSDISQAALPDGMSMDLTKVTFCILTISVAA